MKTLVIMTILGTGVLASGALAADVSIKGNVAETLDASNNYFLSNSPSGPTAKSLTAGTLDILARTPTTNYLLDTYYSYYKYFGPGAADAFPVWGTPAHASFSVDHTEQLTKYNAAASWTRSDAATTSLAQTGSVGRAHGSVNTYAVNGGIAHDLSRADVITWTANASRVTFTDPTQFPFDDVTTTATWRHDISATTSANIFASFDWFSEDNPAQSQRLLWIFKTELNSKLSPRLTFVGHVGWAFVNSYQTGTALTTVPPIVITGQGLTTTFPGVSVPFVPQVGTGNSPLADIALTYQLLKTTTVSLTAAQAVVPLFTGQIQKSDVIGLTLTHNINQLSTLAFSTQFSFIPATAGNSTFGGQSTASEFFSAGVNYSYQLAREWRTNLSYTYRQSMGGAGTGVVRANSILFSLSRDFTLLGNPTAINVAEKERARERAQQSIGYVFPGFH